MAYRRPSAPIGERALAAAVQPDRQSVSTPGVRTQVASPLRGGGSISEGSEREACNACKVLPVPRQQDALARQGDAGDQTIAHADRLTALLEGSSDLDGPI